MNDKPKKKLTNIRPREVSLVDNPANQKDFLLTKNQDKSQESTKETQDQPVLKKLEVAVHTLNFFKNMFPEKEDCMKFMAMQGIDPTKFQVVENDMEWRFVVNDAALFEGTSLAMSSFVPLHQGVDSLVGVLKNVEEEIEKAGAKISSARLSKLKALQKELSTLIEEVEAKVKKEEEGDVKKDDEKVKKDDGEEAAPEGDAEKKEEGEGEKKEEAEPEKKEEAAPEGEQKEEGESEAKSKFDPEHNEAEIKKMQDKMDEIEKKYEKELSSKDEKIEELEKRISELENMPDGIKSNEVDNTQDVQKSENSFWNGVL